MKMIIICVFVLFILCLDNFEGMGQNAKNENNVHKKIALVLSGGGAKGFAHVGVLKVIDSLHIPVDMIIGTSMGSIVGGFYALGYSACEIEQLIRKQDWEYILTDKVSRKNIPLSIRDEYDRYTLSFPIKPGKGKRLPKGLVHGQNIINLFCQLSYQKNKGRNMEELPIKFACIAADVVTGKIVVIDSGSIAEAMRASMSIPYVFTPVDQGDMLLVDGGLRNNFPANIARQLGADIVIGVDVQSGVKNKKNIRTANDMVDQAVYFLGEQAYRESLECVDVYIKPETENYGIGDFYSVDSLIYKGKCAAYKKIDQLIDIQKMRQEKGEIKYTRIHEQERFLIRHVKFSGLENIPDDRVKWRVTFRYPGYVGLNDIRKTVDRIYGTLGFETVYYRFEGPQYDTLNFILKEKLRNTFNIGLHFDTWENAALLLNTTFRSEVARDGSRISLNLKLSQYPRLLGSYLLDNGAKPGLKLEVDMNRIKFYDYEEGKRERSITAGIVNFNASVISIIRDSYTIGIGASTKYYNCDIENHVDNAEYREKSFLLNYFAYIRMDTREKANYPKSGVKMSLRIQKITDDGWAFKNNNLLYSGFFEFIKPINWGKVTFIPQIYLAGFWGSSDPAPIISHVTVGGPMVINDLLNHIPFIGLRPFEWLRHSALVIRGDLQWEMWKRNYLIYKFNVIKTDHFASLRGYRPGMGLAYSYESVIGPMEAMVNWSGIGQQFGGFVSIGYWF